MMTPNPFCKALAACLAAIVAMACEASAADHAKSILNSLDPKSMNELFAVSRNQPDAALTNIAPVSANTFRFLFIWPASNPAMTYDRVGRSFAERFAGFAGQMRLLVRGFCLPSRSMYFGTAVYGDEEVNVAYRDIQVYYQFGWQPACTGRYISISEIEQRTTPAVTSGGYGSAPLAPMVPSEQPATPEQGLKPFLSPPSSPPSE
jgi:hypothetical protein